MNKFNLGGQTLKVIKAVTPPYLITGLTPSQHLTVLNVVKGTSEHATLAAATAAAIYDSHVQAQSRKAPQGAENGHVNTNSTNANDTAATKSNLSNVLQKAEEIAASSSSLEDDVPIRGNQRYALMQKLARGNLDVS